MVKSIEVFKNIAVWSDVMVKGIKQKCLRILVSDIMVKSKEVFKNIAKYCAATYAFLIHLFS